MSYFQIFRHFLHVDFSGQISKFRNSIEYSTVRLIKIMLDFKNHFGYCRNPYRKVQ